MAGLNLVLIPEMIWELAPPDVLVMERMGHPISQVERLRGGGGGHQAAGARRRDHLLHQVFPRRLLPRRHAPGQHHGQRGRPRSGAIFSLDFGIIGTLTEVDKEYLAQNFTAFFRRDYKRVAELHIESGWVPPAPGGRAGIGRARRVRAVLRPAAEGHLARHGAAAPVPDLRGASNVEIQPQLVLLQKTLLNIEGLGRQLDPELDLWSTAKPFWSSGCSEQIGLRAPVARTAGARRRITPKCCPICRACCTPICSSDQRRAWPRIARC